MPAARAVTRPPQIDAFTLSDLSELDPSALRRGADLELVRVSDLTTAHLDLTDAVLDGAQLAGVHADETDLQGARLSEVDLDRVNLPVLRSARGRWRDVRITGRLGAVEAYESEWRSVHLVGCRISYLNLRGAELVDVALTDCVVDELDLVGATARRVALAGTRLGTLDVQRAELYDVDLRGATLEAVHGLMDLRGATISPDQLTLLAPLMADGLGLRVES